MRLVPCDDGSVSGGDTHVDVAGLGLDHWETTALHDVLTANPERPIPWSELLVESVGFLVKFGQDYGRLSTGVDGSPHAQAQARKLLIDDATLGLALMEEGQRRVDAMVLAGEINEAKRLAAFRNKLGQRIASIKAKLGQAAFAEAEKLSTELVERNAPHAPRKRAVPTIPEGEEPRRKVAKFQRKVFAPAVAVQTEEREPNRLVKPMVGVLVVLVSIWALLVLPQLVGKQRLPVLEADDLPASPAFAEVVARPPSLFVTVDTAAWGRLADDERRELIAEVGRNAEAAGYNGAVFREPGGRLVGQWLKKTGVKLLG